MPSKQVKEAAGSVALSLEARIKRVVKKADSQHVREFMGGLLVYLIRFGELSQAQREALGRTEARVLRGFNEKAPSKMLKNLDSALGKQSARKAKG